MLAIFRLLESSLGIKPSRIQIFVIEAYKRDLILAEKGLLSVFESCGSID